MKKHVAAFLVLMLSLVCMLCMPAFAADEPDDAIKVTLPTALTVYDNRDGTYDVSAASIINQGRANVVVSDVSASASAGWSLVDWDSTAEYTVTDAKYVSAEFFGTGIDSSGKVSGAPLPAVKAGRAADLEYDFWMSPQADALPAGTQIATTVVTIGLDGNGGLAGITVTTPPDKTEYEPGENFDPAGMTVEATYFDGSKADVTDEVVIENGTDLTLDQTQVDVTYTEDNHTATAPVAITVKDPDILTFVIPQSGDSAGAIFDGHDGTSWTMSVKALQELGNLPGVTKDDYLLYGWKDTSTGRIVSLTEVLSMSTPHTFEAVLTPVITFDGNGGRVIVPYDSNSYETFTIGLRNLNDKYSYLPSGEKDGVTFVAWLDEDGNQVESLSDLVAMNQPMTLTADYDVMVVFEAQHNCVWYDGYAGANRLWPIEEVATWDIDDLPVVNLHGHKFTGWFYDVSHKVESIEELTNRTTSVTVTAYFGRLDADNIDVTVTDYTNGNAVITTPEKWQLGENSFTVAHDGPCVVGIIRSEFFIELECTYEDGVYKFTYDDFWDGDEIAVAVRGDADMNGVINVTDGSRIAQYWSGNYDFTVRPCVQQAAVDIDMDGDVDSDDADKVSMYFAGVYDIDDWNLASNPDPFRLTIYDYYGSAHRASIQPADWKEGTNTWVTYASISDEIAVTLTHNGEVQTLTPSNNDGTYVYYTFDAAYGDILEIREAAKPFNITVVNLANAEYAEPDGGWQPGTNDFTVTCDAPCAVGVFRDGVCSGELTATHISGDTHQFTADLQNGDEIVIILMGDADKNGMVDVMDASHIAMSFIGMSEITDYGMLAADSNHDGMLSIGDASLVAQSYSGVYTLHWNCPIDVVYESFLPDDVTVTTQAFDFCGTYFIDVQVTDPADVVTMGLKRNDQYIKLGCEQLESGKYRFTVDLEAGDELAIGLQGDVDMNTMVTVTDATRAGQITTGVYTPSHWFGYIAADADNDAVITADDATFISWTTTGSESISWYTGPDVPITIGSSQPFSVTVTNLTNGAASYAEPAGGWQPGTNDFTVTCDAPCAVGVFRDGVCAGELNATHISGDTHQFTADLQEGDEIVIILMGDANADGSVSDDDVSFMAQSFVNVTEITDHGMLASDINHDGRISVGDVTYLSQSFTGSYILHWNCPIDVAYESFLPDDVTVSTTGTSFCGTCQIDVQVTDPLDTVTMGLLRNGQYIKLGCEQLEDGKYRFTVDLEDGDELAIGLQGDVDMGTMVTVTDASRAAQITAGVHTPSHWFGYIAADADNDAVITDADATAIVNLAGGEIPMSWYTGTDVPVSVGSSQQLSVTVSNLTNGAASYAAPAAGWSTEENAVPAIQTMSLMAAMPVQRNLFTIACDQPCALGVIRDGQLVGEVIAVSADGSTYGYDPDVKNGDELAIVLVGDANCDGLVDASDGALIEQYVTGEAELTVYGELAADIDHDGDIDADDALCIAYLGNGYELTWNTGSVNPVQPVETVENIDVTVIDETDGVATVASPENGWVAGENSFTVSSTAPVSVYHIRPDAEPVELTGETVDDTTFLYTADLQDGDSLLIQLAAKQPTEGETEQPEQSEQDTTEQPTEGETEQPEQSEQDTMEQPTEGETEQDAGI